MGGVLLKDNSQSEWNHWLSVTDEFAMLSHISFQLMESGIHLMLTARWDVAFIMLECWSEICKCIINTITYVHVGVLLCIQMYMYLTGDICTYLLVHVWLWLVSYTPKCQHTWLLLSTFWGNSKQSNMMHIYQHGSEPLLPVITHNDIMHTFRTWILELVPAGLWLEQLTYVRSSCTSN